MKIFQKQENIADLVSGQGISLGGDLIVQTPKILGEYFTIKNILVIKYSDDYQSSYYFQTLRFLYFKML